MDVVESNVLYVVLPRTTNFSRVTRLKVIESSRRILYIILILITGSVDISLVQSLIKSIESESLRASSNFIL